jgi:DnaJ domain
METSYYDILGVAAKAPPEVIKAAYRALINKHHPDKNGNADDGRHETETTKKLNEAYEVLSDPLKRKAYDSRHDETNKQTDTLAETGQNRYVIPVKNKDCPYYLKMLCGNVVAVDAWSDTHITSKGGGGVMLMGYGYNSAPKVNSRIVQRQRISVNTVAGRVSLDTSGKHIPVVVGDKVEVVQAVSKNQNHAGFVALINRSGGKWHCLETPANAGKTIMSTWEKAVDGLRMTVGVGLLAVGIWMLLKHLHAGIGVIAGFIFIGLPVLIVCTTTLSKAYSIGKGMYMEINNFALGKGDFNQTTTAR